MSLQKVINGRLVEGIVGEFSDSAPKTARAYITFGKDETSLPEFGKMFSFARKALDTGSSAKTDVAVQGTSPDSWAMGILVNPKEHYVIGFTTSRTMQKSGVSATIATRGHIWVMANTDTVAGAPVYTNANGDLGNDTLEGGTKVNGARWLKTVNLADDKTEVLSEVEIDTPALDGAAGPESVGESD